MRLVLSFLVLLGGYFPLRAASRLLSPNSLAAYQDKATAPRLFELETGASTPAEAGHLLPSRVYAIFHPLKKGWFLAFTNFSGKFNEPLEILYQGTILPGAYLGARNPYQNYLLTKETKWTATTLPERHFLWVQSEPEVFKKVVFLAPDTGEETKKKPATFNRGL